MPLRGVENRIKVRLTTISSERACASLENSNYLLRLGFFKNKNSESADRLMLALELLIQIKAIYCSDNIANFL
jgi:hypothetical protein